MSFGFSIGDFIAGADLAYKLIRVMSETRGASIEYQEALAELCGIQQTFMQITQLGRSEILPKATLNALAQISMPSMTIIADFLDRTKHYQSKLTKGGGLGGSWCKVGWALYRRDELKLLRDTLHARLSAINALLAAANHLPAQKQSELPKFVSQFQVAEESTESEMGSDEDSLEMPVAVVQHDSKFDAQVPQVLATFHDALPSDDDILRVPQKTEACEYTSHNVELDAGLDGEAINEIPAIDRLPQTTNSKQKTSSFRRTTPTQGVKQTSSMVVPNNPIKEIAQSHKHTKQDYASFQSLFEKAMTIQAEAEAKAKLAHKVAQETEWRQRLEENIRLKAEADIYEKMERAKVELEQRRLAEQQQEEAEKKLKEQALQEAAAKIEEMHRMGLGKDKLPVRFKDAVGRKFNFPFHLCQTWQGMEELIRQAFLHVDVIGPHVDAGHYDLVGPNGEIILPQIWERVIEPDWAITMHMWPMDKPPVPTKTPLPEDELNLSPNCPPGPKFLPPPPFHVEYEDSPYKKKSSFGSFMSKSFRRLKGRRSSSAESLADDYRDPRHG
ncbi:hypothetical protein GGR53DRAFT_516411 [Hypoxylon sp. FL1150]|nr:hypothetical protein GGR53DRAFT_516411 [Hypoxylon sp. FL1150]